MVTVGTGYGACGPAEISKTPRFLILYDYRKKEKQKKTQGKNGPVVNLGAFFQPVSV
jgi:hypothetical protein